MLGGHSCRKFVSEMSWTAAIVGRQEQAKGVLDWLEWNWAGISIESFRIWLHAICGIPPRQIVAMAAASIYPFWNQSLPASHGQMAWQDSNQSWCVMKFGSIVPNLCSLLHMQGKIWQHYKIANFLVFWALFLICDYLDHCLYSKPCFWQQEQEIGMFPCPQMQSRLCFWMMPATSNFPNFKTFPSNFWMIAHAVELSNVMHGRKMKALRVPKSNLTDEGWATVNRLKTELGVATTSWDGPKNGTNVEVGHIIYHLPKKTTGFQGISPSWQALSFLHFVLRVESQAIGIWD